MKEKGKTLDEKYENLKFKKITKKQKLQERGITLIALVVTIVILLILTGVTLNIALSDNGLFSKTKKAAEDYKAASEREYLEQNIASAKIEEIENGSANKLGEVLNKKDLEHSSNWHILKVNDKSYDTGNYIKKGTELPGYGKAQNSWIVNYDTGEIIQLEEDNGMSLSATDTMEIKDHIIFNLDSSIIDGDVPNTKGSLEEVLGNGVQLYGFDYNGKSGLTNTSFNFDGVNDYITLPFTGDPKKLFDGGLTLEFYGIFNGPGHEKLDNGAYLVRPEQYSHDGTSGLFQIVNEEKKGDGLLGIVGEKYDDDFAQINWLIGYTNRRAPVGLGGSQR